ncbi:MAG: XdhC family protein [Acidimicrobiales bacterium]|jgi:xanthine dehydrogenase accessory factor
MKEILADIERWREAGRRVALARVVGTQGSAPREPGAAMAVNEDGEAAGSVSGGCVETAVVTEALDALATGKPRLATFGYSDDEAFAVGLTCGGTIRLFVEPLGPPGMGEAIFLALRDRLAAARPVVLATLIEAGAALGAAMLATPDAPPIGSLGDPGLDGAVLRDALGHLDAGTTAVRRYGPHGEATLPDAAVFIESFAPPPRMLIFGAVDFAAALARIAKVLGYWVTVCDARPVFATQARFPMADEIVVDWPDRYLATVGADLCARDAICVLTHDPKFDIPAVVAALDTAAGYIGAMGSRRTAADREQRLREAGVGAEALTRVMAPIGLDIGARTPEETAISICAEIVALRSRNHTGAPLRATVGPIHNPVF